MTLMSRVANMNKTMAENMTAKKDMAITANSSINIASKATATSMAGT